MGTDIDALFLQLTGGAVNLAQFLHFSNKGAYFFLALGAGDQPFDQRMLRCQNHIAHAVNSVGAGGVYPEILFILCHLETQHRALAAADPVFLHGFYFRRPAGQFIQII